MIEVNNASYRYNKHKIVLQDLTVSFMPGKIYGLLGKNGEGKTTLLHLICGLLKAQSGSAKIDNYDCACRTPEMLGDLFLIPEELILPNISLKEFIGINAPFYKQFDINQLEHYLQIFDLDLSVHLGALSMGEKKKVFMSFALAANTRYLIMDEPSNGLDIPSKAQFRKAIMLGMSEQKTIIISTHQVRDIDSLLDHIIMLHKGRLLLNHEIGDICKRLSFGEISVNEQIPSIIYKQPSVNGHYIVLPKQTNDEDSNVNIELLFNATLTVPEEILTILNNA